ncbi:MULTISPECIES: hypothetical protein [Janthinobacterium]|uniref:hypothetical protein n=1 Tax=Janthinobacterium TaxID=29580 RepID=UPI001C63268D|nr:hypothetical protein [Janthinobacterium sp. PAMC25594]QYG07924.1 hypothetical protein KY494_03695 [Janthinobacterium sp. PAMC25594]
MRSKNDKVIATNMDIIDCARQDDLTAQKVEVGIIFQEMLDTATAAAYLAKNKVPIATALRVLTGSRRKRAEEEIDGAVPHTHVASFPRARQTRTYRD